VGEQQATELCGILPVWKPEGWTSFDVIAKLRGILQMRKLGHGGTLDPMATGVLPVFVGKAAKLVDFVPKQEKTYRAEIQFGGRSDTGDRTGKVEPMPCPKLKEEQISNVFASMEGEQMQIPPMYSAVKVDGRRLYALAREGVEVERTPRPIFVYQMKLVSFDAQKNQAVADICCSKGTYVRVLAEDAAEKLDTGGYLISLARLEAFGFGRMECYTLEEIATAAAEGRVQNLLKPGERMFDQNSGITLPEEFGRRFCNGEKIPNTEWQSRLERPFASKDNEPFPVFSAGKLLGMGEIHPNEAVLRIRRLFHLD